MPHHTPRLRTVSPAVAVVLAALALGGCSKRITSVDSSFRVEGTPSASQLFVFQDSPTVTTLFRDTLESGPSDGDYVIDHPTFYTEGPGTIRGMIFDYTPAGDYQVFRQESNGGFLSLKDFPIHDAKQWVDSGSELYRFVDRSPRPGGSYVGRGIVNGVVNASSPLTNLASATTSAVGSVAYTGARTPSDSLFTLAWSPVAGAAGYWLQVFVYRSDLTALSERILAGAPAPIFDGKSTDLLVAYMPSGVTSY